METKHFIFYFFIFIKIMYFNTEFVSLQYKNTNQYFKMKKNIYGKSHIFKKNFLKKLFWAGQHSACGWAGPSWLLSVSVRELLASCYSHSVINLQVHSVKV
jgi:hypothetical protein